MAKDNTNDKEWDGMPEFVQEKQKPFSEIKVRFASQEALDEFSRLIGQKLIRDPNVTFKSGVNNYGMIIKTVPKKRRSNEIQV